MCCVTSIPVPKQFGGIGADIGTGWFAIIGVSLLLFPKLALGLSGFETGVAVASHVRGRKDDDPKEPKGRIANTRKLLITAAVIMSLYLLASSVVVSTLIEPDEITPVSASPPPSTWSWTWRAATTNCSPPGTCPRCS